MKTDYEKLPDVITEMSIGIPQMTAKCIARTDKKAMYYRWDNVWEVFRIKIKEKGEVFGRSYPKREVYPGNEDFGSTAWCFSNEQCALRMYKNL